MLLFLRNKFIVNSILQKIKVLQNQKNLTTPKLAENIGLSRQGMYDILKGKIAVSIKHLELLSNYFQVPMTYWFEEGSPANALHEPEVKYNVKQKREEMKELYESLRYFRERCEKLEEELNELKGNHNPKTKVGA